MIVMKFGGSSLADTSRIMAAAEIVAHHMDRMPIVVVSAMEGVTNELEAMVGTPEDGPPADFLDRLARIEGRHLAACAEIGDGKGWTVETITQTFSLMRSRSQTMPWQDADAWYAFLVTRGERLMASLFSAALFRLGHDAAEMAGEWVIRTYGGLRQARIDFDRSSSEASLLASQLVNQRTLVIAGFTGQDADGRISCLGRGGSDSSATAIAMLGHADEVHLLKTEEGIMTADPRIVPDAGVLPLVSYREAAALAGFGAKVLHPLAIHPVRQAGIPLRVMDSRFPDALGSLVSDRSVHSEDGVKSITSMKGLTLVSVAGEAMWGNVGFSERVSAAAAKAKANIVTHVQDHTEQTITVAMVKADALRFVAQLERDLDASGDGIRVSANHGFAAVAAVGDGMEGKVGTLARIFNAVSSADINVRMVAQAAEHVVSFVVEEERAADAVMALHKEFRLEAFRRK